MLVIQDGLSRKIKSLWHPEYQRGLYKSDSIKIIITVILL